MIKKFIQKPDPIYCPRCDYPLLESNYQALTIHACPVCKGVLANRDCLEYLVEDSQENLALIATPTEIDLKHSSCDGTFVTHKVHPEHELHIDVCNVCKAVWFDYEELEYTDELKDIATAKQGIEKPFRWYHGLFVLMSQIPIEFNARPRKIPWITVLLILINVAVFIAQANHNVFFTLSLSFMPAAPIDADWFKTLFTSMFAHGSMLHLLGNMYFLYLFGDNVEDILGKWRFVGFYLAGGFVSALAVVALGNAMFYIGSSGAIAALMGAYLIYFRAAKMSNPIPILWLKKSWRKISPWIYIGIFVAIDLISALAKVNDGVAHWAHLGGFIFGVIFASLTYKSVLEKNKFLKFINNEKQSQQKG